MSKTLRKIAFKIRHVPLLEKYNWFWDFLRKPYHQFLNLLHHTNGVKFEINRQITINLPPAYTSTQWQDYEPEHTAFLINWVKSNPKALILDLGCSTGYFSAICLFASEQATVIAFDSDLESLQSTRNMAQFAKGNRLNLIYGFVSAESTTGFDVQTAIDDTNTLLASAKLSGKPGTTKYINLDHTHDKEISTNSIDTLFKEEEITQTVLIKCDVEGAEFYVLTGAKEFILKHQPNLLLSVHPDILPVFDHSVKMIKDFLFSLAYSYEIIAIDHEEHWFCKPGQKE